MSIWCLSAVMHVWKSERSSEDSQVPPSMMQTPKPEVIRHGITLWAISPVLNTLNSSLSIVSWNSCISTGLNVPP